MFLVYGLFCEGELFYIGKTTGERLDLRLVEHKSRAKRGRDKNVYVYNKIRKIFREGKDVTIRVLHTFDDEATQTAKEIELIALHGRKSMGGILYNSTDGGEGTTGNKHTDEARKKMSASKMGNKNNVGVKRPDVVERWAKKVYVYDFYGNYVDDFYESCHAAGEDLGISFKKVSECILYSRPCKVDRYSDLIRFSYDLVDKLPPHVPKRKIKRIAQYTLDNEYIREYDSVKHLVTEHKNFKKVTIVSAANGTSKSAYGYIWKYLD